MKLKKLNDKDDWESWLNLNDEIFFAYLRSPEARALKTYDFNKAMLLYRSLEKYFQKMFYKQLDKEEIAYEKRQREKVEAEKAALAE